MNKILKTISFWLKCLEAEIIFARNSKAFEKMNDAMRKANRNKR